MTAAVLPLKPGRHRGLDSTALAERMYAEIYHAIMGMRLAPETKLTEKDLCEIYGLPRHQVRQVLAKLESDGLVDIKANRGAFIANPTEQEAREMFEVRMMLEAAVLEKIVPMLTPESLAALSAMVEEERIAFRTGNKERWVKLSAEFHIALARLTGNETLVSAITKYVTRTTLLISSSHPATAGSCSFDEHLEILETIRRKDLSAAVGVMRSHLAHCERRTPVQSQRVDLRAVLGEGAGAQ
ncbi:MAG: GntR family transcriptional regulator [Burkholderiaceae bacterium]